MERIPVMCSPDTYIQASFIDEPFIELRNNGKIIVDLQYPQLSFDNSVDRCYVREKVGDLLVKAAESLPQGYKLKIFDCWRPFALQKELYEVYRKSIITDYSLEDKNFDEQEKFISGFISLPIDNADVPPVHTTGGAVDLTIVDKDNNEIPMGTGFDSFLPETNTAFFENNCDITVRDNRRMLYQIMTDAGFTNLPAEWWHFDYGNRFWAFYNDKPAIYKGVFDSADIFF